MHAVISWFESSTDIDAAINALKQAGFSDEAITVRDRDSLIRVNGEQRAEALTSAMVAVQAEGERAAEAWSILQDITG
jgi:hypothetical protein